MNAQQKRQLKRVQQAKVSKLLLDRIGLNYEKSAITDSMIEWANRDENSFLLGVKRCLFVELKPHKTSLLKPRKTLQNLILKPQQLRFKYREIKKNTR